MERRPKDNARNKSVNKANSKENDLSLNKFVAFEVNDVSEVIIQIETNDPLSSPYEIIESKKGSRVEKPRNPSPKAAIHLGLET